MARIHAAIDGAEAVIFVLSPDSLASTVCGEELDYAFGQNKRVIPVLHREPEGEVREDLAELNWIFARQSDPLERAADRVVEAVETDLVWLRAHTRLLVRAAEWDRHNREASYTLRGRDLSDFEDWQARIAGKEPRMTRVQSEYLLASRRAKTRRQQLTWGGVTVAVIVAAVLGTLAWLQSQERARQAEIADARRLLSQAEVLRGAPEDSQAERRNGLRAAVQALATLARLEVDWTDADRSVRQSYASVDKWEDPFRHRTDWRVANAAFSPDGQYALLYTELNELVLLDIAEGDVLAECRRGLEDQTESRGAFNRRIALAPDARHAALRTSGGTNVTGGWSRIAVWDLEACAPIAQRQMGEDDPEKPEALVFAADGSAVLYWARDLARSWRFAEDAVESLKIPPGARDLALGPDQRRGVAAARVEGERAYRMQVFDLATGTVEAEWTLEGRVDLIAWGAAGILIAREDHYAILDTEGKPRGTVSGVPLGPSPVSADGEAIAVWPLAKISADMRKVEVRTVTSGETLGRAARETGILAVVFAGNADSLIVVGDYGFDVEVWHFREAGAYARLTPRDGADRIAFDADGAHLHADRDDGRTSWRLPADAGLRPPEVVPKDETTEPPPNPVDPSRIPIENQEVVAADYGRPDRRALLVCTNWTRGGCRRVLEIWEGDEKRAALDFEPVLDRERSDFLQFAGSDSYLVVGTRAGLEIIDWQSLETVGELFAADVNLVEVAPGFDRVATSGQDGAIRVWNLADNAEVARIEPTDGVRDLALSGDGRWLAVLTEAGDRVDLYALAPADLVAQACRWLDPPCP